MKRVKTYSLLLIIAICFVQTNCNKEAVNPDPNDNAYCDSLEAAGIVDDYTYPTEYYDDFQIPEDTLIQMCTHGLVETIFNWKYLKYIVDWQSYKSWWIVQTQPNGFNGIIELTKRPDAPKKVYNRFMEFDEIPYADSIKDQYAVMRYINGKLTFMEIFLAREECLKSLSELEKDAIAIKTRDLWPIIDASDTLTWSITANSTCYLLARLMYFEQYQPFLDKVDTVPGLAFFIEWGDTFKYETAHEPIWTSINEYLNH